jgi:hypothetical protein
VDNKQKGNYSMMARTYTTVEWRKYLIEAGNPRIKKFLDSRGKDVFNQVCSTLNEAVIQNRDKVLMVVHPNSAGAIIIPRDDFEEVYDIALSWFEKKEMYEECALIQKYKLEILNKITRKKLDESKKHRNLI